MEYCEMPTPKISPIRCLSRWTRLASNSPISIADKVAIEPRRIICFRRFRNNGRYCEPGGHFGCRWAMKFELKNGILAKLAADDDPLTGVHHPVC